MWLNDAKDQNNFYFVKPVMPEMFYLFSTLTSGNSIKNPRGVILINYFISKSF